MTLSDKIPRRKEERAFN